MMRSFLFRLLSVFLCLMLTASLAACGTDPAENSSSSDHTETQSTNAASEDGAAPSGFVWKSSFQTLSSDSVEALRPVLFTDDGFYALGVVKLGRREPAPGEVESYEGEFDILGSALYFIDSDGTVEKLPGFLPDEPAENTENKKDFYSTCELSSLARRADGRLIVLQTRSSGWYNGPDELYGTEEQYEEDDYYSYEQSFEILTLEPDGTELSRSSVVLDAAEEWIDTSATALDPDGNLIVKLDEQLCAITPDGSVAWSLSVDGSIQSLVTMPDGTIGVVLFGEEGLEYRAIDMKSKQLESGSPVPDDAWSVFPGDENYDLYYTSGMYLFGFRLDSGTPEQILSWITCDINGDSVNSRSMHVRKDGSIIGMVYEYSNDDAESQLFTLTRVPAESVPVKQVLTVAQLDSVPDYQLTNLMVRFNRSHDNVRLEYLDYSRLGTEDDPSAGLTVFSTEIMAGQLPDIIPTGLLDYRHIAAKGFLEDLYPYLDSDPTLRREDFFPNLLAALEVGGGLYQVVPGFSVETLSGAASIVGDTPGWTYEEFYAALAKMPEGCLPLEPYVTRSEVLNSLLCANMGSLVDWSTGKVNFETDAFRDLLEFVRQFPAEYNWEEDEAPESTQDLIRQGRQMLTQTYLYGLDAILWNDVNFGGKATLIGWPTTSGVGSIMRLQEGYAISHSCSNKEAAWEFLRGMLLESAQMSGFSIPSNRNAFQKQLKEYMTPIYMKDEKGNYVLDENGNKIEESRGGWTDDSGEEYNIYAMTQEQADELLEIIETCTRIASYDTSIYEIVYEEAQAFFAGQKSVDDVARLIQSKVNIYVNEQR